MKKNRVLTIAAVLLLSLAVFFGVNILDEPVLAQGASSIEEYEQEIEQIEKEMQALKEQMDSISSQKDSVVSEMTAIDLQIEQTQQEQVSAQNHIIVVEYEMEVAANKIQATEEHLAERQELFKERLVEIYTTGDITLLDVLFNSSSFKEFITNYDMLEKVLAQDTELLDSIKAEIEELNVEKANLEEQKEAWQKLNQDLLENIAELDVLMAEKEEKQAALENDLVAIGASYDALEKDSAELEAKIEELQRQSTVTYEGVFSWPLPHEYNYITSEYKMRLHPIKKVYSMHTGIDISAPRGVEIYAASSGEVILSQYYGSFGECVIVDHGNGVSTLYGHMSKRNCKVGDIVERGDVIGYVGTTGLSTGNHLHFEVRINGAHTSPWDYVTKP